MDRQARIFSSAQERLVFLDQRRYRIPKEGAIPSLQLGQLLDVQSQVADAKSGYAESLADRERAKFDLNRASGILVQPGCEGLQGPGTNNCLTIFRQHLETDRRYRKQATQTACDIAAISERPACTWLREDIHSKNHSVCPEGSFGTPERCSQCACETTTVGVFERSPFVKECPPVIQEYAPVYQQHVTIVGEQFKQRGPNGRNLIVRQSSPGHSRSYAPAQAYPPKAQSQRLVTNNRARQLASMNRNPRSGDVQIDPSLSWPTDVDRTNVVSATRSVAQGNLRTRIPAGQSARFRQVPKPPMQTTANSDRNSTTSTNQPSVIAQVGHWDPINSLSKPPKASQAQGRPKQSQWDWPQRRDQPQQRDRPQRWDWPQR